MVKGSGVILVAPPAFGAAAATVAATAAHAANGSAPRATATPLSTAGMKKAARPRGSPAPTAQERMVCWPATAAASSAAPWRRWCGDCASTTRSTPERSWSAWVPSWAGPATSRPGPRSRTCSVDAWNSYFLLRGCRLPNRVSPSRVSSLVDAVTHTPIGPDAKQDEALEQLLRAGVVRSAPQDRAGVQRSRQSMQQGRNRGSFKVSLANNSAVAMMRDVTANGWLYKIVEDSAPACFRSSGRSAKRRQSTRQQRWRCWVDSFTHGRNDHRAHYRSLRRRSHRPTGLFSPSFAPTQRAASVIRRRALRRRRPPSKARLRGPRRRFDVGRQLGGLPKRVGTAIPNCAATARQAPCRATTPLKASLGRPSRPTAAAAGPAMAFTTTLAERVSAPAGRSGTTTAGIRALGPARPVPAAPANSRPTTGSVAHRTPRGRPKASLSLLGLVRER